MALSNKRYSPRQHDEAAIEVLALQDYAKYRKHDYDYLPAKMYNSSEDGLYFEIDRAIKPGLNVSVKLATPAAAMPQKAYPVYYGRVAWCKKIGEAKQRFGIGIHILRKVIQAKVESSRFAATGTAYPRDL